tara:strand:+ start:4047 stop:4580 length:534 start_codon:yes stop_codon:yes gene_type:complete
MICKALLIASCLVSNTEYSGDKFLVQYRAEAFVIGKPTRKAEWDRVPSIRICAETKIPTYRVSKALAYWRTLGYEFGPITVDNSMLCPGPRSGEIVFMLPTSGFDTSKIASTSLYTHIVDKNIVMAKINITPRSAKKERVIEHEIGHALGWNHYNQKFHIMNSNWFYGGYDSKGLRK